MHGEVCQQQGPPPDLKPDSGDRCFAIMLQKHFAWEESFAACHGLQVFAGW